jgi:Protein of unknown function (DUF4239)
MSLAKWLSALPLPISAILIIIIPTGLAMLVCAGIRRRIGLDKLTPNNEVAGFKFAVLGVMYAVLLGFAVIVVWEKFHDAEAAVQQQAGSLATLFRLSDGLPEDQGDALRHDIELYLRTAIRDWPAMSRGESTPDSRSALNQMYVFVLATSRAPAHSEALVDGLLTELNSVSEARRAAITLEQGTVPSAVWAALLAGAFATVGFTFFFGTDNARAQIVMTALLAFVVFIMLWVVVVIDYPFAGPVSVGPEPFENLLRDFVGHA